MEIKYRSKKFLELKIGETFVETPDQKSVKMKISDCTKDLTLKNAVNLNTGEVFCVFEKTIVYPVSCHLMRNA